MGTYLSITLIFFLAGFAQGLTGFGSSLVAMPLLLLLLGVKTAVPLAILNGVAITVILSCQLRQHLDRRKIIPLVVGSLPGIWLGVTLLQKSNGRLMQGVLGGFQILYALYALNYRPQPRRLAAAWSYLAGFATGVIGSAFSAGGPPTVIYTTLSGWSKEEIKATMSAFFLINGVLIAAAHAASGLTSPLVLRYFAASAPAVVVGVFAGASCFARLGNGNYVRVLLLLLLAMGIMMLGSAWTP